MVRFEQQRKLYFDKILETIADNNGLDFKVLIAMMEVETGLTEQKINKMLDTLQTSGRIKVVKNKLFIV